jgi:hypothetical protein
MKKVNRFLQNVTDILETASAVHDCVPSSIAILVNEGDSLRIVDASGWRVDALQREYQASTTYTVKRSSTSVVVEAQSGSDHCTLKKTLDPNPLASLMTTIPHHLVRAERFLSA